jgi:hypothetical protein
VSSWNGQTADFHSPPPISFNLWAFGAKGGDILAFHMKRHGLAFHDAAKALGAWEGDR